jgi:FkbH-like protein
MQDIVAGELTITQIQLPLAVATQFSELASRVVNRSQIVWSEHCSECGFPLCYSRCEFYSPRADFHCRRFTAGIERVVNSPLGTNLVRIRFRKWGKLEGTGPVKLHKAAVANHGEPLDGWLAKTLNVAPLPFVVRRSLTGRWNRAKRWSAKLGGRLGGDTVFVIEAFANDAKQSFFTVTFLSASSAFTRVFQESFEVGGEYTRLIVPTASIATHVDLSQPFLVQIEPVRNAGGYDVTFGLCDFAEFEGNLPQPVSLTSVGVDVVPAIKRAKVLVWDLDDTLWQGTLAEHGLTGVTPRPAALDAIRELDARGVLHSIASKNNFDEAMAALRHFGIADYFVCPELGWHPKSDSLRQIAARLELNVDSFVFIDDEPFEQNEALAAHPKLRVLPHTAVEDLTTHPWFDLPVTPESRRRREMYRAEESRMKTFERARTDYLEFLRSCEIVLDLTPLSSADFERVHELSQRTNQLNFTGARLTRTQVAQLNEHATDRVCLTMRCTDRFGDYGLIGFAILELSSGYVTEFFMSCRVQRKRVEQAFFAYVAARFSARGHRSIHVRFRCTERNATAQVMLADLGFVIEDKLNDTATYCRDVTLPFVDVDVVRLIDHDILEANQ